MVSRRVTTVLGCPVQLRRCGLCWKSDRASSLAADRSEGGREAAWTFGGTRSGVAGADVSTGGRGLLPGVRPRGYRGQPVCGNRWVMRSAFW
jgi:hypothetical protein